MTKVTKVTVLLLGVLGGVGLHAQPYNSGGGSGAVYCADSTGSTTTYTCPSPSPSVSSLTTGLTISFVPQATNTGSSTVNVGGLGAKTLKQSDGATNLGSGAITGGSAYLFVYNGSVFTQIASGGSGCTLGGVTSGQFMYNNAGACATAGFANDTNVTASVAAGTATLGWSGTLASSRGGLGLSFSACTGAPTFSAGTASCSAATGTLGSVVFSSSPTISAPTISGHPTVEGVTSTGAQGTGAFVFATSPTLTTPTLGVATATTINKVTLTAPATGSTLTLADGKTLTVSNSITLAGTDTTTMTFPTTSATLARTDAGNTFTGHQTIEGVTSTGATGTGNFAFSISPTFTGTVSAAALTLTGTLTTNVTGASTQCLQASATGVVSGFGGLCGGTSLSGVTAATAANTIANGDNGQVWNWAETTAGRVGMTFGETSAATSTGTPYLTQFTTLIGSTATPLNVSNSLNGTQTLPALSITPIWNTTGVVDAALFMKVTNTASGAASLLMDLQVGSTSEFKVDKAGNVTAAGTFTSTLGGSNAGAVNLTQGTDNSASLPVNSVSIQAPTSVATAFTYTLPGAQAAGLFRGTNANPSVISVAELSGDCSTSGSNAVTCTAVHGVSIPATGASFPALLTLTATNTTQWNQINGGAACGDSSHAVSVTSGGVFGCQSITGSASVVGASGGVVYNNAGAATSITTWTTNGTTTITGAATAILDVSAGATLKVPVVAGCTSGADGSVCYDSTNKLTHVRTNAADSTVVAATATSTTTSQVLHATGTAGVGSFSAIVIGDLATPFATPVAGGIAYGVTTSQYGTTSAGTAKQVVLSGGAGAPTMIDYQEVLDIPFANCNNTTAGAGVSLGSGGTITCRAGTNNLGGYASITDTASTFVTFQFRLPEDWDTASNPSIRFGVASTDATNAHTIIPSIQVACYKGDLSTTDDVAANAAHSSSTITLNGNANRFSTQSNVQMNSTDMTGCVAGALVQVTVGRATDTATNAEFYDATVTIPRLLTAQAN